LGFGAYTFLMFIGFFLEFGFWDFFGSWSLDFDISFLGAGFWVVAPGSWCLITRNIAFSCP
jgi:hypothetical protein